MAYLLDANVFIGAKNLHYGFDFCPAFWDWIIANNASGGVFSIEKVSDEVVALAIVPAAIGEDVDVLRGLISDRGKIRPRRQTGTCARHQRRVAEAIKRARHMALLPFAGELSR